MSTTIGKLRSKIYLIQFTNQAADGRGGLTSGTTVVRREFWGDVKEVSSSREQNASQLALNKSYRITARYSKNEKVKAGEYIIHEGKVLVIGGSINTDNNRFIEIQAEEIDRAILKSNFMTYNYTAEGGETEFTAVDLLQKEVLMVFMEGDAYRVDLTATGRLQVKSTPGLGKVSFASALEEGALVEVLYQ